MLRRQKRSIPLIGFVAAALAVLLAGCRVDAIAPVNLSDLSKIAATQQPITVTARLLLTFTSRQWCEDMGASLVVSLKGAGLNMAPVSCGKDPDSNNWHGELRMPIQIASSGSNAEDGDLAYLAVKSGAENPGTLSVLAHLDAPRLKAAQDRLLNLPAAQGNEDARVFDFTVTIMIKNDLANVVTLKFDAMTMEGGGELAMPVGGVRTVTVSKAGLDKLLKEQSVAIFSIAESAP